MPNTVQLKRRRELLIREIEDLERVKFKSFRGLRHQVRKARVAARKQVARLTAAIARSKIRRRPSVVLTRNSPNQSDRTGGPGAIAIIVLHSTESHPRPGNGDLASIAEYFQGDVDASSHVITDDDGHSARCVPDARKAWT